MAEDVFGIVGTTQGGNFRVERVVAEGGFSVVYRAHHGAFRAPVALKCLKIPGEMTPAQREAFLEKFREEAEILFRLSASIPEVVRPLHVDTLNLKDGRFVPFLALEWLEGEALDEILYRRREQGQAPMGLFKLVKLLRPVARGLSRAHRFPGPNGTMTVVHRDVKPENILVAQVNGQETVKILDFGISIARRVAARKAGSGFEQAQDTMNAFTPRYAAPEQWAPEIYGEAGPWTDVWGLAVTMVEALAGRPVVDGDVEEMRAIVFNEKRRPTPRNEGVVIADALEEVFQKALTIDPRKRTRDIEAFWNGLEKAMGLPPSFARKDVRAETVNPFGSSPPGPASMFPGDSALRSARGARANVSGRYALGGDPRIEPEAPRPESLRIPGPPSSLAAPARDDALADAARAAPVVGDGPRLTPPSRNSMQETIGANFGGSVDFSPILVPTPAPSAPRSGSRDVGLDLGLELGGPDAPPRSVPRPPGSRPGAGTPPKAPLGLGLDRGPAPSRPGAKPPPLGSDLLGLDFDAEPTPGTKRTPQKPSADAVLGDADLGPKIPPARGSGRGGGGPALVDLPDLSESLPPRPPVAESPPPASGLDVGGLGIDHEQPPEAEAPIELMPTDAPPAKTMAPRPDDARPLGAEAAIASAPRLPDGLVTAPAIRPAFADAVPTGPVPPADGRPLGQLLRTPIALLAIGLIGVGLDRGLGDALRMGPIRLSWIAMTVLIVGLGLVFWRLLSTDADA